MTISHGIFWKYFVYDNAVDMRHLKWLNRIVVRNGESEREKMETKIWHDGWLLMKRSSVVLYVSPNVILTQAQTQTYIYILYTHYTLFITLDCFSFVRLVQRQCNIASTPLACCLSHSLVACLLQHRLNYVLCLCIVRIVFATRFVVSLFRCFAVVPLCMHAPSVSRFSRTGGAFFFMYVDLYSRMRFCCSLLPILNFRAFVSVWISLFPERHTIAVDNIRPPLLYTVYAMQMLANIRNTNTHKHTTRFARLSCQVCVDIQCRFNVYFVCERDDVEFQMYKIHFVTLCFSHLWMWSKQIKGILMETHRWMLWKRCSMHFICKLHLNTTI